MAQLAAPSSRDKILDVAEVLFARRGFAGVGVREVAERAGLGKSSLFHHFESKDVLHAEVLARVLGRIRDGLAPIVARRAEPAVRLDQWVEALVDALADQPTSARLLMRALLDEDRLDGAQPVAAERVLNEILGGIQTLLGEGVGSGAFREVSVPQTVQTLIGATLYHFASGEFGESLLGGPLHSAEAVKRRKQELVQMLRHGLLA